MYLRARTSETDCGCCWVPELCPTLRNAVQCRTQGFLVLHCVPEFVQIHVHWGMPSNHLILCCPLLLLPLIFHSIRVFSNGKDGQSIGALASVLPLNIHGWFPLGLTSLISLLSRVLYLSSNASPSLINSETLGNCLLSLSHLPLLYLGDKKSNHLSASLCGLNKLMHGKGSEHVPDVCCVIIIIFPVFISPRGEKLNKTS